MLKNESTRERSRDIVTAVTDESRDCWMSHPSEHVIAQKRAHPHAHTHLRLYNNLAAGISNKDIVMFVHSSDQPISCEKGVQWKRFCHILLACFFRRHKGNMPSLHSLKYSGSHLFNQTIWMWHKHWQGPAGCCSFLSFITAFLDYFWTCYGLRFSIKACPDCKIAIVAIKPA